MQFILGLCTAIVLFLLLSTAFYLGYRRGLKQHKSIPIDEAEKRKREQFDKHFKALFNYDVETALKRKKVT